MTETEANMGIQPRIYFIRITTVTALLEYVSQYYVCILAILPVQLYLLSINLNQLFLKTIWNY